MSHTGFILVGIVVLCAWALWRELIPETTKECWKYARQQRKDKSRAQRQKNGKATRKF
jgi:hypothetical protein